MDDTEGFLAILHSMFGTNNLYEVLGVASAAEASDVDITRRFRKRALQLHPGRLPEVATAEQKAAATKKFQALGAAYQGLPHKDRRKDYDKYGQVDDDVSRQDLAMDWDREWRLLFRKITPHNVANFEKEYRHTEEELSDLKQAYLDGEGDMNHILDNVLCCTAEDQERFTDVILHWVAREEVPYFKAFRTLTAAEEPREKAKGALVGTNESLDEDSLASLIMKGHEKYRGAKAITDVAEME